MWIFAELSPLFLYVVSAQIRRAALRYVEISCCPLQIALGQDHPNINQPKDNVKCNTSLQSCDSSILILFLLPTSNGLSLKLKQFWPNDAFVYVCVSSAWSSRPEWTSIYFAKTYFYTKLPLLMASIYKNKCTGPKRFTLDVSRLTYGISIIIKTKHNMSQLYRQLSVTLKSICRATRSAKNITPPPYPPTHIYIVLLPTTKKNHTHGISLDRILIKPLLNYQMWFIYIRHGIPFVIKPNKTNVC